MALILLPPRCTMGGGFRNTAIWITYRRVRPDTGRTRVRCYGTRRKDREDGTNRNDPGSVVKQAVFICYAVGGKRYFTAVIQYGGRGAFCRKDGFTTGLADRIGRLIMRMDSLTEKRFVLLAVTVGARLAAVMNAMIVMAIFMPIISAISAKTDGHITRKNTYLPIAIAAVFGGNLAVSGSTSMLNASAMLGESYYGRSLNHFEPLPFALPGLTVCLIIFGLTGCRLQERRAGAGRWT